MSKMKDSNVEWIGLIPNNWDICRFKDYYRNIKEIAGEKSIEYERLALTLNGVIKRQKDDSDGLQPKAFDTYQILNQNDFVFKMIDLQNISTSRVGLSPYTGLVSPAYMRFSPISNKRNTKFDYYFLMSMYYNCVFNNLGGNGVRSALNATDMGSFIIPNPDDEVKEKIVTYLEKKMSQIEQLMHIQEKQIENLKAYKQSLIAEVVTRGLSANPILKNSGVSWIKEIPANWEVKPLKYIATFGKGLPITKANLIDNGIPVISYGQIHSKKNNGTNIKDELLRYVDKNYIDSHPQCVVKKGDIIFADTSEDKEGIGNAVYQDKDSIIFAGYHTVIAKMTNIQQGRYLSYLFLSNYWRSQLRSVASGIKVFSVTQNMLNNVSVILPDETEQREIINLLDQKCFEIDRLIDIKEEKIKKLDEYKKSLIFECVTGKKEVV